MRNPFSINPEIRNRARAILNTYGTLNPKLQHIGIGTTPLPDKAAVIGLVDDILQVIYPGYFGPKHLEPVTIESHIEDLLDSIATRLGEETYRSIRPACDTPQGPCAHCRETARGHALALLDAIPELRRRLADDVQAGYDGDPAARDTDEVIFAYPAIFAISVFRVAHELLRMGIPLLPRIMTEYAHSKTGIDIHPGATIGRGFFIDHGTGVVIGETTIIGNNVKLYQGVTIGALSFPKDAEGNVVRGTKRHPTIEDNVVVYSGATILGGDTVIGEGTVIGGNVWLTRSVPPHTKVMNARPELVMGRK
jgi:serine O-acetyltransferase